MTDPFAAPAPIPSDFPTVASFRGRLVLIRPKSRQTVPNNLGAPGAMQERITADVDVVDGAGPLPVYKQNQPTGQTLAGPSFSGVWLQSEIIVKQLASALETGGMVLARIDTRNPGTIPQKGNPWGLVDPTEADKQMARDFLAGRMVSQAAAPTPQPVYAQQPQAVPAPAPVMTPQPVYAQQPQAVPAPTPGTNPFA